MVVTSCSGARSREPQAPPSPATILALAEESACGGGGLTILSDADLAFTRTGFERWPLPPVAISRDDLNDGAVGCFDGRLIVIQEGYAQDRVLYAHEYCHALASLYGRLTPPEFPLPSPVSPRARALESDVWTQEIWAVTCATTVTGLRDWSWGALIDDTTAQALFWAKDFVANGPPEDRSIPTLWTVAVSEVSSEH